METSIAGIYAIGDVTGGLLYAHVASREGIIAVKNIAGADEKMDYDVFPSTIFTSPEIASVGLKEQQAIEKGIRVKTGHFQFRAIAKAHAIGEINGFFKIVSDETSDRILGVQIIGPHASDLIHEAALAIKAGLRTKDIAETIHSHPTLSKAVTAIGTSCSDSSRLRAVTTISSSAAPRPAAWAFATTGTAMDPASTEATAYFRRWLDDFIELPSQS